MTTKTIYAVALLALMSGTAHAEDMTFKPYIGLDLQRSNYSYNNNYNDDGSILYGDKLLEDGLNGFNLHVGTRMGQHFGAELGYFRSKEASKNIAAGAKVGQGLTAATNFSTKTQVKGFSLDAMGYIPVTDDARAELIGTAGVTWTKASIDFVTYGKEKESELGFRLGGGAQYKVTDNIGVRGMARYQTADFEDVAERAWTYSLGLNYSF